MVLINKYEINGTIPIGDLKDNTLYKTIIEEYWDNSTYDGNTILKITPSLLYFGEEASINVLLYAQQVTITIGEESDYKIRTNSDDGVTLIPFEWVTLPNITLSFNLSGYDYTYGDNILLETSLGLTGEHGETLIRTGRCEATIKCNSQSEYEMTEQDKQAFINGNVVLLSKIHILTHDPDNPIILTESDGIKSWEYIDERFVEDTSSFIGEFVARELKGELQDMSTIFSTNLYTDGAISLSLRLGVVCLGNGVTIRNYTDEDVHWYTLGTFDVIEPSDTNVRDNTSFDAFDSAVLLNQKFDAHFINDEFRVSFNDRTESGDYFTALELARYACAQYGIEFGNASFTHSSDYIRTNQFTTGDSCRDVMKALAKLACGYCRIGWDDRCYIDEMDMDYTHIKNTDKITPDHYYSMSSTNEQFGPVNTIRFGMQYIEGQDSIIQDSESVVTNGLWALDVMDNPLLYTQELRDFYVQQAGYLYGLKFTQFEMETLGHPWLKANHPIIFKDMDNVEHISYPFNLTIKYNGHIKTEIKAPVKTTVDRICSFNSSSYEELRKLGITVDKQKGIISTINSLVTTTADGLSSLEEAYEETISNTYRKEEIKKIITGIGVDGTVVTSVQSNSATFNEEGMKYEREGAKTSSLINEVGVIVKDENGNTIQFSGYVNENNDDYPEYVGQTIVGTDNIIVKHYLNVGDHSRIQNYGNGTGIYWRG